MDKLPVDPNTIADLIIKPINSLGWLVIPGLMKKRYLNEGIARADIKREVENHRVARQRDDNILAMFEGIQPESATPVERAVSSLLADAHYSQHNREQIGGLALLELESSETPIPEENPLNEDFMSRFYRYSSDIGNEEAQRVWAKLLAGEIKQPGAFSLATLDALRNLTPRQAKNIKTLAPFVFGSGISFYWLNLGPLLTDSEDIGIDPKTATDPSVGEREEAKHAFFELFIDDFVKHDRARIAEAFSINSGGLSIPLANEQVLLKTSNKFELVYNFVPVKPSFLELISLDKKIVPNRYMLSHIASELKYHNVSVELEQSSTLYDVFTFEPEKHRQLFSTTVAN